MCDQAGLVFLLGILAALVFGPGPGLAVVVAVALLRGGVRGRWFVGGCLWYCLALWWWAPLPQVLEGRDFVVQGRVVDFPRRLPHGRRFDFKVKSPEDLPDRLRLSWYGGPPLHPGQRWQLKVRLKPPRGFANPGGFDYGRWLFARGIGATGYVRKSRQNRLLAPAAGIDALRMRLAQAIDRSVGGVPQGGIVAALALGRRDGIGEEEWRALRATGTTHLVAISGLHVGLVAGLLLGLGRRLWLWWGSARIDADAVGAWLAWSGALGYAALAGFSLPTRRALLMLAVALLAWRWRRAVSPWRGLDLALLGVCLLDPRAPLQGGFWLSFGAVAWILYVLQGRCRPLPRWQAALKVQLALLPGLAPVGLWLFGQVGGLAPLANLIAVPLVGLVVVPLVLAGCALHFLMPGPAAAVWQGAARLLAVLFEGLDQVAEIGAGVWHGPGPGLAAVAAALLGTLWLLAPRGIPGRWLGALLWLPLLWPPLPRPPAGEVWVTVLEVGQGLAVVAETASHVLVYDTGPRFSPRFDAGRDIVAAYLCHRGWNRLDRIVVSHADRDHSGGLAGLRGGFPAPVWSSAAALADVPCRQGQAWRWDGVDFEMLWPTAAALGENDRSCVLRIATGAGEVLLPGDLERAGEAALSAQAGGALQARVLVAPHHGSRTSSSPGFLRAVSPDYVLVSSGHRNRFGFPHPEVVARYRALGAKVLNTAESGAIQVRVGRAFRVRTWRGGGLSDDAGLLDGLERLIQVEPVGIQR
ncbi:competence protein ComEC [Methylomarinovum tepidoasis]|uniref:Competence protein ComEC n=1 Tax=Methylomarinovum tepidoasis TaxID=2840183 RepID=A0AAU9D4E9_9GAMM|nr:DNA internalization-related competence protein ComEC/Rec2 [Methylomarinovum sp. IN45]BCX89829.1 competence protein ComEC [Methylomarinovum sp. IN45]